MRWGLGGEGACGIGAPEPGNEIMMSARLCLTFELAAQPRRHHDDIASSVILTFNKISMSQSKA